MMDRALRTFYFEFGVYINVQCRISEPVTVTAAPFTGADMLKPGCPTRREEEPFRFPPGYELPFISLCFPGMMRYNIKADRAESAVC